SPRTPAPLLLLLCNSSTTPAIYPLSLHDALPIYYGALFAGASPQAVEAAVEYAEKVGIAFQLADDVIDLVSDADTTGKTPGTDLDRKSARLNSSHVSISYAVFCLKKKTTTCYGAH